MELNSDQQSALQALRDYCLGLSTYDFAVLTGYAGVGKSTLLGKLVESLPNLKVGMTAPTHKAVRVIRRFTPNQRLYQFGTIHSFFGLKQNIREGKIVYENEYNYMNKLKVDFINVLIIDEGSMLDTKLLKAILDYKKRRPNLKLIITGDPFQLPPVGEKESLAFSKEADKKYAVLRLELTKIMRQTEGNPILEFATEVRNAPQNRVLVPSNIEVKQKEQLEELIDKYFTSEYSDNPDYCKIIAYTNEAVDSANQKVRNKLFNNPTEAIVVGDELIADKPIPISDELTLQTSEELTVEKVSIHTITVEILMWSFDGSFKEDMVELKVYNAQVRSLHPVTEQEIHSNIQILHPNSKEVFNSWLTKLRNNAIMVKNKKAWVEYYAFENCLAQVKYNFSLTVHKSQGSSFDNVILMDSNIFEAGSSNPASKYYISPLDRNKLRYVGTTRSKNKLVII
jgi:exodeoxyribonuclease-5